MTTTWSYHPITISEFWNWHHFKIRNPLVISDSPDCSWQEHVWYRDKLSPFSSRRTLISVSLFIFNRDTSFYSCIIFFVFSKFCQEVYWWQQQRLDVLYLTAKLQFISSTVCIFLMQVWNGFPQFSMFLKPRSRERQENEEVCVLVDRGVDF